MSEIERAIHREHTPCTKEQILKLAESALHNLDCVTVEQSDENTDWERIQAARLALKLALDRPLFEPPTESTQKLFDDQRAREVHECVTERILDGRRDESGIPPMPTGFTDQAAWDAIHWRFSGGSMLDQAVAGWQRDNQERVAAAARAAADAEIAAASNPS